MLLPKIVRVWRSLVVLDPLRNKKLYLESGRRQVVPVPLTNFKILVSTLEEMLRPAEVQVPESEAL